jgi:hypothetical protein
VADAVCTLLLLLCAGSAAATVAPAGTASLRPSPRLLTSASVDTTVSQFSGPPSLYPGGGSPLPRVVICAASTAVSEQKFRSDDALPGAATATPTGPPAAAAAPANASERAAALALAVKAAVGDDGGGDRAASTW